MKEWEDAMKGMAERNNAFYVLIIFFRMLLMKKIKLKMNIKQLIQIQVHLKKK